MPELKIILDNERAYSEKTSEAGELYSKSRFGEEKENQIQYSLVEVLYLLEKDKAEILAQSGKKPLTKEQFIKKASKIDKRFWIRYVVYRDLRNRGYIVKTALKFGADFRIYDRGVKPGEDHARWIAYPVHESETSTWYEFAAKNRVAHSTRKRLLLAVVDEENDVSYWESNWIRP